MRIIMVWGYMIVYTHNKGPSGMVLVVTQAPTLGSTVWLVALQS